MAEKQQVLPNFFANRQSQLATVLIGILVVVAGFLVYNYFKGPKLEEEGEIGGFGELITPTVVEEGEVVGEYTVKVGDTLSKIAQEVYGNPENWREIAKANDIPEDNPAISVGQKLTLPEIGGPASEKEEPTPTEVPEEEKVEGEVEETPQTAVGPTTYTVERGDTLWEIAERFYGDGSRWHEIFEANSLSMYNPNGQPFPLIHASNVLVIP